jgi:hypothetical protein
VLETTGAHPARQRRSLRAVPLHLPSKVAVVVDVRRADEPSAADDGVCLDLYEPAGIEEPLDDDEASGRPDPAEGLAVHLRESVTVGRIHEEHTRSHHVTKRRPGLAKGFVDDLQAPSSLHTDVRVYVAVWPDRGGRGNEDEMLVADSPAEADGRLERRARADVLPHAVQTTRRTPLA